MCSHIFYESERSFCLQNKQLFLKVSSTSWFRDFLLQIHKLPLLVRPIDLQALVLPVRHQHRPEQVAMTDSRLVKLTDVASDAL